MMVGMLLWAWILLDSGACSASLPDITDRKFIDECVREHNKARSSVSPTASNMQHMIWDEGLAITARQWANKCLFEHSPKEVRRVNQTFSLGENIWAGFPLSIYDATSAIKGWVDEKQHYDFNGNGCTGVCGHYTQVVWANSFMVGCAAQLCPKGVQSTDFADKEGVIFVCTYGPAGNVNGRQPYESQGAACSGCKGACVDNLCSANWNGGSDYVSILVVRPIALIFTFITAYGVKHFYPDIFCYE